MLYINKNNIDEKHSLLNINLNYPVIEKQKNYEKMIKHINKLIYEDIICFKDVIINQISTKIVDLQKYTLHAMTEYKEGFNKNYILSIPIEFSQLVGIHDIVYINCYNYDLLLKRKIKLDDIFDKNLNYIDIINEEIDQKIKEVIEDYQEVVENIDNRYLFDGIYDVQSFYIENDGIVICFSSYEISRYISQPLEFKLLFSDYEKYMTKYAINNIYKYEDRDT